MDATGSQALLELEAELDRDGVGLVAARMRSQVRDVVEAARVVERIGETRIFPTVRAAVAFCAEQDARREAGLSR